MDNSNKSLVTDEERTRHEALFFSQDPIEGLLPGEKARELFLLSKLPLQILSRVWQVVDVPHDNMLDSSEFSSAIYLLQQSLLGRPVPAELPPGLVCGEGEGGGDTRVPVMSRQEYGAYKKLFMSSRRDGYGLVQADTARDTMLCSGLPVDTLAHIWNLSDVDRDTKLNLEQFTIACHLMRFCKKGGKLDHPVNVQAMLPHKLPKTDLVAKRRRLSLLEKRKRQLMCERERCHGQASREGRRVELWAQRLKLLTAMHKTLREEPGSDVGSVLTAERLQGERQTLSRMQAVADRLKSEDDSIRKETSLVIIEEQKLSKDVRALEEEAEQLRKRRHRNSVIKDLDPFHQLYEDRKEEKLTGVPREKPDYQIEIPKGLDPFDIDRIKNPPLSGQELFNCAFNNNTDERPPTGGSDRQLTPDNTKQLTLDSDRQLTIDNKSISPWSLSVTSQDVEPKLMALTQGFEDSFVESWQEEVEVTGSEGAAGVVNSPGLKELEKNFNFDDHQDTVFKTVPVTAEEDELWSGLTLTENPSPGEEFKSLQSQLYTIKEQIKGLEGEGPQLVFKDPETYSKVQQKRGDSAARASQVVGEPSRDRRRYRSVETGADVTSRPKSLHIAEKRKKKVVADNSSNINSPQIQVQASKGLESDKDRTLNQTNEEQIRPTGDIKSVQENVGVRGLDLVHHSQALESQSTAEQGKLVITQGKIAVNPFQHLEIKTDEDFEVLGSKNIQSQDALLQIHFDKPDVCRDISEKSNTTFEETKTEGRLLHETLGRGSSQTLDELTTSVQQRGANSSVSRSDRLKKAQSWCVSEEPPVPPPRRKTPKKSNSPASVQGKSLIEKTRSNSVESPSSDRSASIDSSSATSPQRPPRKGLLQKQKRSVDTGNSSEASHSSCSSTPHCSTSSSPVRHLSEKAELPNLEGTASSESSPVPPPRIKKASKKSKGSPGHSHHLRSASSEETVASSVKSDTDQGGTNDSSVYQNIERNGKSEFAKEIEDLFDKVTEGAVKESQKISNSVEHTADVTAEGSLISQGKTATSDYFSQSDGSLIEDDMDAAARKLELEKLRSQYFGNKPSSRSSSSEKTEVNSEVSACQDKGAASSTTEVNRTLITVDDYKTVNPGSAADVDVIPAVRRVQVGDRQLRSFDSDDSTSKRDSGFLEDAFSSVNFEIEPSLQPVPVTKPVKVSLDLDQYQSDFGSSLDSKHGLCESSVVDNSSQSQRVNESDQTMTFVPACEQVPQGENSLLINFGEENKSQEADKDSDISENGGTFKADFDPFAMTNMNQQAFETLHSNNSDNSVQLTSLQHTSEISGSLNRFNNYNDDIEDNMHKYLDSSITTTGQHSFLEEDGKSSDVNRNSLVESEFSFLDGVNDNADSEAPPPPLPSQPPPPLPSNPPPPVTSLRSALRYDSNLLDLSGDQSISRNVLEEDIIGVENSNNTSILTINTGNPNKAEQVVPTIPSYGSVPEEFKDIVKQPTSESPDGVVVVVGTNVKEGNLVQESLPKEEFSADNSGDNNSSKKSTGQYKYNGENFEGLSSENTVVTERTGRNEVDKGTVLLVDESHEQKVKAEVKEEKQEQQEISPSDSVSSDLRAEPAMDPVTGLRRTNVSDPVGKALKFVNDTEMSFRVRKVDRSPSEEDDGSYLTGLKTRSQEIQEERQEILESMKIKKRTFNNWPGESQNSEEVPGDYNSGGGGLNNNYTISIGSSEKTDSERRYEERKRKQEAERENGFYGRSNSGGNVSPQSPQSPGSGAFPSYRSGSPYLSPDPTNPSHNEVVQTSRSGYSAQADIDSRSLTENKEKTKQHWEEHFSSPDAQLFPQHVRSPEPTTPTKRTERQASSESGSKPPRLSEHESAIEREIRLAQEREDELRKEKEQRDRLQQQQKGKARVETVPTPQEASPQKAPARMSSVTKVTKVTTVTTDKSIPTIKVGGDVKSGKKTKTLSPQSYREMTEVDRDSVSKQESIIEREIREQMEREEAVRRQAESKLREKQETNQGEQVEKVKLQKEDSIIEREIRQQREREQETERLRALAKGVHIPTQTVVVQTVQTQSVRTEPPAVRPVHNSHPHTMTTTVTTQRGGGGTSPVPPTLHEYNPDSGRIEPNIGYGDAIATQSHEGESIIARELREQREREEELRKQWQSLGMEVPKTVAPDTPFNMPEPRQPAPIKGSYSSNTATRLTTSALSQKDGMSNSRYSGAGNKGSRRASSDSASSRSTDYSAEVSSTQQQGKPKVQPYTGDDSDEEQVNFRFVPQSETPVEREIRLSKEREEQLRREKGLPVVNHDSQDSGSEVMYETEVIRPTPTSLYRRTQSTEGRNVMKQFASSRLLSEMEKDKQREQDLKSSGKIHTLSEERTTTGPKYVDIIPKDQGPPPMPKSAPGTPKSKSMEFSMPVNGSVNAGPPQVEMSSPRGQEAPPAVRRHVSMERGGGGGKGESIIEKELREMREREDELRQQRVMLTSHLGPTGVVIDVEPRQRPRQNGNTESEVKASRRKSALAEEWEKKFGAAT